MLLIPPGPVAGSFLPFLSEQALIGRYRLIQPVLSVLGTKSERLFVEGRELLRSWFPQIDELTLEGAGHLLHMERPPPGAEGLAEFFGRHLARSAERMAGDHTKEITRRSSPRWPPQLCQPGHRACRGVPYR